MESTLKHPEYRPPQIGWERYLRIPIGKDIGIMESFLYLEIATRYIREEARRKDNKKVKA